MHGIVITDNEEPTTDIEPTTDPILALARKYNEEDIQFIMKIILTTQPDRIDARRSAELIWAYMNKE